MSIASRSLTSVFIMTVLAAGLLVGCGGGDDDAGGCPSFTMDFSEGPDTAYFRSVRPDVEKGLETCPHATIESYPANGDEEQAQTSQNIASNFLSSIGDAVETKTRLIVDAPSSDLEGKVRVILSDTAPTG